MGCTINQCLLHSQSMINPEEDRIKQVLRSNDATLKDNFYLYIIQTALPLRTRNLARPHRFQSFGLLKATAARLGLSYEIISNYVSSMRVDFVWEQTQTDNPATRIQFQEMVNHYFEHYSRPYSSQIKASMAKRMEGWLKDSQI